MTETNQETESTFRATFFQSSMDPDVTLIIRGKEFKEYSHTLCGWSGHFDKALTSGMKEQDTYRLEMPERSPEEWQWIASLMGPMAEEKITMENLATALDWFDFLCSIPGLRECDRVLSQNLPVVDPRGTDDLNVTKDELFLAMEHLEVVVKYNLKDSKTICFRIARHALVKLADIFTKEYLQIITSLVKDHVECRSEFLGPLKTHLPSSTTDEQADLMIVGDMLHEMVQLGIDRKKLMTIQDATARMIEIAEGDPGTSDFRKRLKNDAF